MKKILSFILLILILLTACRDILNPVDPESELYIGTPSVDADNDGIGQYEDVDEIIPISPVNGKIISQLPILLCTNIFNPEIVRRYWVQVANSHYFMTKNIIFENDQLTSNECTIITDLFNNDTSYYWRAKAYDGNKWSDNWSTIQKFRIKIDIGTVTLTSPIDTEIITDTTPLLNWKDLTGAKAYQVQLGTDDNFIQTAIIDENTITESYYTIPISNMLVDKTTYYWRVKVKNADGIWGDWCNKYSFTVSLLPPDDPIELSGSTVSTTEIKLNWIYNSQNNNGFKIECKIGEEGVYTQIVGLDKNLNEYIHNGLSPGLTYFYRIKAFNSYGDSNYSNEISAITNGIDYTIINSSFPVRGITNTIYNGSFIIKNLGIVTGRKNVTWVIYRSQDTVINAEDIQIATGDISALDPGEETSVISFFNAWPMTTDTYYIIIKVSAADDGNIHNNNVISESIYVASPFIDYKISNVSFPNTGVVNKTYNGNFTIRNLGNVAGSQDINWNVYLSDNSVYNAGVDTQIDAGTQVSISAGQTTSTISFNNIWTGSTGIYYLIILISETDDSDISNDIVVSSAIIVGTLPNSPNLISPSNGSYTKDNTPYFDWSSVSEAEEYNIQVDNNSSFSSPEIDQTISSSSYTPVSSLSDGTCYWRVKTKNSFGNWGNWSSTRNLIVDTQSPVQGNLSINNGAAYTNSTSVTLTLSASGASEVQFKKDSSSWSSWYSYSSSRSWTINSGDGSHYIYVKYKDLAGNESPIISDYIRLDTSAPSVPLGLSTETRGMKKIRLNWNSSSDSGIGMEGYKIYRDGSYIASTSSTTYTDSSGLYIEDSYSYRVLAYDDYGYESSKCTSAIGNTGVIKKYWASNDGYADEFNPSNIYDLTYLKTGPQGDAGYNMDFITCIKFDLSSLAGKTISSAYLNLVIDGDERERPTVYRLTTSSNWSESSLTWNSYLGMSWDTQYSNSNPSLVHSSASSPYERHQFNVEKIVELWVEDDETNNGFIVRCTANQGYTATYTSYYPRESYNTEQRPFLEIFYY